MGLRAALYLRVSTVRQAEKDLSIPDQQRQAVAYCAAKGWTVAAEFVEPGASATDDKRPEFQRLTSDATRADRPFDVVLVHSFSRFFRDSFQFEFYRRKLEKNGVALVSMTQEVGDDPTGHMIRQVFTLFDEYQSKENAKHVLRAMKENARQGYWNGALPPYGYWAKPVEKRGDAIKKKLEINPTEAAILREIFDLHRQGKGIRAIADHMNRKGVTYRKGRKFASGLVHGILTREACAGRHYFNRTDSKTRKTKDRSEWVEFATPVIIEPGIFRDVQRRLAARRPSVTPPRIVNGPTLLTGVAKCGSCGGGMTIRTGKGGRYRYYSCNNRMNEGATTCKGRNIRMDLLDGLVLDQLEQRIFAPGRLDKLLAALIDRKRDRKQETAAQAKALRQRLSATEDKARRLYDALAEGTVKDTDLFRTSLSDLERDREDLIRQVASMDRQRDIPRHLLSKAHLDRFATAAGERLRGPDSALRKAYVRQFVERIDVSDDEIRITGPNAALASGLLQATNAKAESVPGFDREWWCRQSAANPSPRNSLLNRELTGNFCSFRSIQALPG